MSTVRRGLQPLGNGLRAQEVLNPTPVKGKKQQAALKSELKEQAIAPSAAAKLPAATIAAEPVLEVSEDRGKPEETPVVSEAPMKQTRAPRRARAYMASKDDFEVQIFAGARPAVPQVEEAQHAVAHTPVPAPAAAATPETRKEAAAPPPVEASGEVRTSQSERLSSESAMADKARMELLHEERENYVMELQVLWKHVEAVT